MSGLKCLYFLLLATVVISQYSVTCKSKQQASSSNQEGEEFIVYPRKVLTDLFGEQTSFNKEAVTIYFEINQETKVLELRRSNYLIGQDSVVEFVSAQGSTSNKALEKSELNFCYYNGVVRDEPDSCAAVSICNGLVQFYHISRVVILF